MLYEVITVHPHLPGPQRARVPVMFPCHQVLSVGGPDGVVELAFFLFGQLFWVGTVGVHDPDVFHPVPVARVGNLLSVRAVRNNFV